MNKILIIAILFAFSYSCNTSKKVVSESDYVVFTLRKTPCKGKCPVYYMEIYKSGKVSFEGKKNVDWIGSFSKQIDVKEVDRLVSEFEKANFFGLEEEYTSRATDLPTTLISFTNNAKTKAIRDYQGAPKVLKDLENQLDAIAKGEGWTRADEKK